MKDVNDLVFDPPQISTATIKSIEASKSDPTFLDIGIPGLSDFVMARKDKVIGIPADTSQGKTSVMTAIARNMASQIDAENGEIGVFITWEDNIEDFGLSDIANFSKIPVSSLYHGDVKEFEFKRLLQAATERAKTPLWLVGHSEASGARPRMTMTDVWEVMDYLVNKQGRKLRFCMMDYLQRINRQDMRKEGEVRMQYSGVMDSIKDLALAYHPATFVGSQISRAKAEGAKWRQPQIHWAMETSNFEHTCDGAFSLWLPHKSKDVWSLGDLLGKDEGGNEIYVSADLMLIQILKQKRAASGMLKAVDFLPEYNLFVPYLTAPQARIKIKLEVSHVF